MEIILTAVTENDEKQIANRTTDLEELNYEMFIKILNTCTTKKLADLLDGRFLNNLNYEKLW